MVKKIIFGFVILVCFGFLSFGRSITTSLIWLDQLGQSTCYVQDWGTPQMNKSVLGTPLKVNGIVYKHGVGAHSISRILLDLNSKALSVSGLAGADDNNLFAGHLQFKILGDKKILWRSGIMKKGNTPKKFNVSLSGIREVLFLVEECGDGIMYDHGPLEMVAKNFRGVLFSNSHSETYPAMVRLVDNILKFEGKVIFVTDKKSGIRHDNLFEIEIKGEDPNMWSILSVIPIQMMVIDWAKIKGMTPGEFSHGGKVTVIE